MNKKRIITLLIVLVILAILLFLAHTVRNFIIIKGLQENVEQYVSSTNYHVREVTTSSNQIILTNYYEKEEKQLYVMEQELYGERAKLSLYINGETKNAFVEKESGKTATLNAGGNIDDYIENKSDWKKYVNYLTTIIKEVKYDGKECYALINPNEQLFVEKDTGLLIGICGEYVVSVIDYKFNTVKDEIFIEPNLEEYLVMDMAPNT